MSEKTFHYFKLYKPHGIISQFVSPHRKKRLLGELYDFPEGVNPIGRLDEDSEGLLLLTNDYKLHPYLLSHAEEKEYHVQLHGKLTDEALQHLQAGVNISLPKGPYTTRPCKVQRLEEAPAYTGRIPHLLLHKKVETTWVSITLQEGKNRQIRRMTAAAGFPTLRLVRIRIGPVLLAGMNNGEVQAIANPWPAYSAE